MSQQNNNKPNNQQQHHFMIMTFLALVLILGSGFELLIFYSLPSLFPPVVGQICAKSIFVFADTSLKKPCKIFICKAL